MRIFYTLILIVPMLILSSCASTATEKIIKKSGDTGTWKENSDVYKNAGKIYFTGIASGAMTETEAFKRAESDAFAQVSKYFGVEVNSTTTIRDRETSGKSSYDIGIKNNLTGTSIKLKNYTFEKKYVEKWKRKNIEYDAKVLLSIPVTEMNKIKMATENLCGWSIKSEDTVNEEMISQFVREFGRIKKLNIQPSATSFDKFGSENSIINNGETSKFLLITIKQKTASELNNSKIYLEISVDLISVIDKIIIDNYTAQFETSDTSKDIAEKKAYNSVFEQIYVQ